MLMISFIFQIDGMSKDDMAECLQHYDMKSPVSGNDLSEPMEFNLMFSTSIGPTGNLKGLVTLSLTISLSYVTLADIL